jgi:hypothetical protein
LLLLLLLLLVVRRINYRCKNRLFARYTLQSKARLNKIFFFSASGSQGNAIRTEIFLLTYDILHWDFNLFASHQGTLFWSTKMSLQTNIETLYKTTSWQSLAIYGSLWLDKEIYESWNWIKTHYFMFQSFTIFSHYFCLIFIFSK